MSKKAVLLTAVLMLAGCTPDDPAPTGPTIGPAPAVSVSAGDLPEDEAPGGTLSGLGADADWDNFVLACADTTREPVIQTVATGDLTGDQVADAVVARSCTATSGYTPSTVEVFDGRSPASRPWRIGTALLADAGADRPWVTGLAVQSGVLAVQAHGAAGAGCPRLRLTYRYQLKETAFQRLDRVVATSPTCLPIQE